MMREIKFRGKDYIDKWRYGDLVQEKWGKGIAIMIKKDKITWSVLEQTVGQYTGIKDTNGKEIYEGDIIRIKSEFDNTEIICEIIYLDGAFRTKKFIFGSYYDCLYYWYANDCELEVIGNIYENSELLKGE